MFKQRSLSAEQALQKLRHYCGYQERCHQEVRDKGYSFGLRKTEVETAIATLIGEDRLNEERFALQFAGGHFRLKHWGKVKIRYELKGKGLSDYCVTKALAAIDETDYTRTLHALATRKWAALKDETAPFVRRRKLHEYLLQKGYEHDRIEAAISGLSGSD
ncbi:MAG TPA: regulatory protein RecX [Puia sp.]|nr:regulatory protein RecX [Puia sp.]